jgi:hypothetical protein
MFDPKASGSLKRRSFITLFAASFIVAFVNLVPPVSWANWWGRHHPIGAFNPFDTQMEFYLASIWILLVTITLVFHGRHGLWLLLGMPFALFYPSLVLLWATGCLDSFLERLRPPDGLTVYGFNTILVLLYAGSWILIDVVIAYVVCRSRSSPIEPSMRADR